MIYTSECYRLENITKGGDDTVNGLVQRWRLHVHKYSHYVPK